MRTRGHRALQPVVELELVEAPLRESRLDVLDHVLTVLVGDAQVAGGTCSGPGGVGTPAITAMPLLRFVQSPPY